MLLLSIAAWGDLSAEEQPPRSANLDSEQRDHVVEAVARYAEESYLLPDVARELGRTLRMMKREGAYDDVSSPEALASRLTTDLQRVAADRHLKVLYSERPRPLREGPAEPSADEKAQQRLNAVRQNFGIERVEHLDGNVGYLKLVKFEDPSLAAETLVAAMRFLANTDALMIDLRKNGGGHSDAVALLSSFFFEGEPIHLVDFFNRATGETSQSWTVPFVGAPRYTDKPVYILTSGRTFSAAEQFAFSLQELERAVVVGEPTRGGAHFVEIFQIGPHFGLMIPVGAAASPVTGSNWEGDGVMPTVPVAADSALQAAHLMALEELLAQEPEGRHAEYLEMLAEEMKASAAVDAPTYHADPALYPAYVGRFDAPMGMLTILVEGGTLVAQMGSEERVELTPVSEGQFAARSVGASLRFEKDDDGNIGSVRIEMGGRTSEAPRVD